MPVSAASFESTRIGPTEILVAVLCGLVVLFDGLDTQAVTNRHNWNTSKQIGNIAYTLYATNRLRFFFDYDRVTNQGQLQSTRTIDFVGSPTAWGSFARANPYEVVGPVNNEAT